MTETDETPRRLRTALWVGLIGAILALVAGVFGAHGGSVWGLPNALEQRVVQALDASRLSGLDVRMQGQEAVIGGIVADDAALAAVPRIALSAAGAGGPWAGGVTYVDVTDLRVGPFDRPYLFRVVRSETQVTLTGAAPSDRIRADLIRTARAAFPNAEIVDDLRIAGGAPSSEWGFMARNLIRALSRLDSGEARMTNERMAIIGAGAFESVEALRAGYANPAPPFRARVVASVDGLDLSLPELQGLPMDGSEQSCARALDRVQDVHRLSFVENGAELSAESTPGFEALAAVALRCDRHRLQVIGPAGGGPGLSAQRAQYVAGLLAREGVLAGNLRTSPGAGRSLIVRIGAPS